ncbi:MAG: HNH endonuclease [Burkholderiaceae bacterium]
MTALTRREARQQWRNSIKEAWDNRCAYCGKPPIDDDSLTELTIDHVKPKSRGGEDRTRNVIPACRECNQAKSSQEWVAWYRMQPFYTIEGEWRIRQWLHDGITDFGPWDEEDAKKVDDYINEIFGIDWPTAVA